MRYVGTIPIGRLNKCHKRKLKGHVANSEMETKYGPEEVNKARVAVIEKNRLRGYYGD